MNVSSHGYHPSLSGDGTKVAWVQRAGDWGLYVGNADGSGTPVNVASDGIDPSLSGDGTRVAWGTSWTTDSAGTPVGSSYIYVGNADGSGTPVKVSSGTGYPYYPSLSGDGKKVAWLSFHSDGSYGLYVGNADGSGTPVRWSHTTGGTDGVIGAPSLQGN